MSKQKYTVRITRTETYVRDITVEADSWADAKELVERREEENEYAEMFDCPDYVKTDFGKKRA